MRRNKRLEPCGPRVNAGLGSVAVAMLMLITPTSSRASDGVTSADVGQAVTEAIDRSDATAADVAALRADLDDAWSAIAQLQEQLAALQQPDTGDDEPADESAPVAAIDLSHVADSVQAGGSLILPSTLAPDTSLNLHLWARTGDGVDDVDWSAPIYQRTLTVGEAGKITVTLPNLPGTRELQVQTKDLTVSVRRRIVIETSGTPSSGNADEQLELPVAPIAWSDVRTKNRPPNADAIAEVVLTTDPNMAAKLRAGAPTGKWLVIRGDKLSLGSLADDPTTKSVEGFNGWIKLEVSRIDCTWANNSILGTGSDCRVWLENATLTSNGAESLFSNVDGLYVNGCKFTGFGHPINSTGGSYWIRVGAVINSIIDTKEDAFQDFHGDVKNVRITNTTGAGHPDVLQELRPCDDIEWDRVWCGSLDVRAKSMGLRSPTLTNSRFTDVRWYGADNVWTAIDIRDANKVPGSTAGTVFKGCVWDSAAPGGAVFFNVDPARARAQ